ncbi:MAG: glycosyltransferase family 4 protein [Candidatus Sumerlaeaceae bacterium]|nr:glycosyltransferase family 4 protein [Candidatus Sumerlaeaceae bacterium]
MTGRRTSRIDVVAPSLDLGDGVSYDALRCRQALLDLGVLSDVYCDYESSAAEARAWAHDIAELGRFSKPDAVLFEYSTDSHSTSRVLQSQIPLLLRYQNITPPYFFEVLDPEHAERLRRARERLAEVAPKAIAAVCPSHFNASEVAALGCQQNFVVPNFCRLRQPMHGEWSTGRLRLVYVGRIVPNKCQHELIQLANVIASEFARPVELLLFGSETACPPYASLVRSLAQQAVARVSVHGRFAENEEVFDGVHLYVSLSEHEGFGMPLVEAMSAGIPVLAYAAAAVPETVAGGGLLFEGKTAGGVAALIEWIAEEPQRWRQLRAAALARAKDFAHETIRRQLASVLQQLGFAVRDYDSAA